jgi:Flp pilus assembly pilin Flp
MDERATASRWLDSARAFVRDDRGSELVEYSLALAFFAVIAIVGMQLIPKTANTQVTTDDNNFSQSLANGY